MSIQPTRTTLASLDDLVEPNFVAAGPSSGASVATATYRALVAADLPPSLAIPGTYTNADITIDQYGRIIAAASGSGGGGGTATPGGSTGNLQYNDNGVINGTSNLEWNGSQLIVTGSNGFGSIACNNPNTSGSKRAGFTLQSGGNVYWFIAQDLSSNGTADFFIYDTTTRFYISAGTGMIGVGTSAPTAQFEVVSGSPSRVAQIVQGASGQSVPLVGLQQIDSTGNAQTVAFVDSGFNSNTHASYTGSLTLSVGDYAGQRIGLKIQSNGSVAQIGHFGATPVSQPVLSYSRSGAGETGAVADIRAALAALGLILDSTTA